MATRALVLLSGGQDSTTCLFWARARFQKIYAIGFHYGQKHVQELTYAQGVCQKLEIPYHIYPINPIFSPSSLVENKTQSHFEKSELNAELPASFVPMRNALFLTLAATYGIPFGIRTLVCGASETDYSGYPDCRAVFIEAQARSLSLAIDEPFRILTPLMYLNKAEVWKLAQDMSSPCLDIVEIIRTETLTDYNGDTTLNEWGRGKEDNPASLLRAKGYREAKAKGWVR